jgi:phenylacetate-CoA ligase
MGKFAGRADNMVKLRGVNVWPEAVGRVATAVEGATTEYFVRAIRVDGHDELVVSVASDRHPSQWEMLSQSIAERLHQQLGVRITAVVVGPGDLDALTEVSSSPKAKRFRDERRSGGPTA